MIKTLTFRNQPQATFQYLLSASVKHTKSTHPTAYRAMQTPNTRCHACIHAAAIGPIRTMMSPHQIRSDRSSERQRPVTSDIHAVWTDKLDLRS